MQIKRQDSSSTSESHFSIKLTSSSYFKERARIISALSWLRLDRLSKIQWFFCLNVMPGWRGLTKAYKQALATIDSKAYTNLPHQDKVSFPSRIQVT
jgi:hypothetical protein